MVSGSNEPFDAIHFKVDTQWQRELVDFAVEQEFCFCPNWEGAGSPLTLTLLARGRKAEAWG